MPLEMLDCDAASTNLFTYIDGPAGLFVTARNFTESSRFAQRLCIQRPQIDRVLRLFDISSRRYRIVDIQNEAKQYLPGCDFIFGLEDDTIPPPHALRQLQRDYAVYPYAGFMVALAVLGLVVILAFPRLRDVASPSFIASLASRATTSRAIPPGLSGATIKPNGELASVREWARGQGYSVSDRGRISANVMAAYEKAH